MTTKSSYQGQVQVELLDQPVNICGTVVAKHLGQLRPLGATLQSVSSEDVSIVWDALALLGLGASTVDTASGLGAITTTEGRLVQQDDTAVILQDSVACRNTCFRGLL